MIRNKKSVDLNDDYLLLINHFYNQHGFEYFYSIEYFNHHLTSKEDLYFQLYNKKKNCVDAVFSANFVNEKYISLFKGTFGSFLFKDIDLKILEMFINNVVDQILLLKPKEIIIKLPPSFHNSFSFTKTFNILIRKGFCVSEVNLNHFLEVKKNFIYEDNISKGNFKKLIKSQKKYIIKEDCFEDLNKVYDVLELNRNLKGLSMSLDYQDILSLSKKFKKIIKIFAVIDKNDNYVASSFCIIINPKILYVFYWGEIPEVKNDSPVVMLSKAIYNFCQKDNIDFVDVGISSKNSIPNYNLCKFKERIGYNLSSKINMSLKV